MNCLESKKIKPTKRTVPDFLRWLHQYLKKHGQVDPIADLAADAKCDKCFPRGKNFKIIFDHLTINHSAYTPALRALKQGFELYTREYDLKEVNYSQYEPFFYY